MMRILEVCWSPALGGLELYMANISRFLQERGHAVWRVVAPRSALADFFRAQGTEFGAVESKIPYLDVIAAGKLARLIRRRRIDIIHAHQSQSLSTLILARKMAGRGALVFTRQMETSRKQFDPFHRWVYSRLDALIAITDRVKQQALENTVMTPEKVHRLYYGIDTAHFVPDAQIRAKMRQKYAIAPDELAIGIVGRLEEGKGQHILLRAVARILPDYPRLKVLLIGDETVNNPGFKRRLQDLVEELNMQRVVLFTGFIRDTAAILPALDLFILASRKETFGLSLIEAMACGVPSVATAAGGVPEIVSEGKNGLLVPPFDVDALEAAIRKMIGSEELRRRFSVAGRQTVREKFDLQGHLAQLEKIFAHAINV